MRTKILEKIDKYITNEGITIDWINLSGKWIKKHTIVKKNGTTKDISEQKIIQNGMN